MHSSRRGSPRRSAAASRTALPGFVSPIPYGRRRESWARERSPRSRPGAPRLKRGICAGRRELCRPAGPREPRVSAGSRRVLVPKRRSCCGRRSAGFAGQSLCEDPLLDWQGTMHGGALATRPRPPDASTVGAAKTFDRKGVSTSATQKHEHEPRPVLVCLARAHAPDGRTAEGAVRDRQPRARGAVGAPLGGGSQELDPSV
jgi:hypothetical protein